LIVAYVLMAPLHLCRGQTPRRQDTESAGGAKFKLVTQSGCFMLAFVSRGRVKQVVIPRDWLVPPEAEKEEEEAAVSSFNYDERVTSFPIGEGRTGLHLSSYEIMNEGSLQAGAGRDVFLVFDPNTQTVRKGTVDLGVTKQRFRDQGCFTAKATQFVIGDINQDGLADLGLVGERIQCKEEPPVGPFYTQDPVSWYVFSGDGWKLASEYSGRFPYQYSDLPLLGIASSPVDYVGQIHWKTCDPAKWLSGGSTHELYVPAFRTQLIKQETEKPSQPE